MMKALAYLVVLLAAGVAVAQTPSPAELLPELRKGGYVLFLRHPQTNPDQADTDPLNGVSARVVFEDSSGGGLLLDAIDENRPLDDLGQQRRTVQRSPTL
jgi:hypothetical protein